MCKIKLCTSLESEEISPPPPLCSCPHGRSACRILSWAIRLSDRVERGCYSLARYAALLDLSTRARLSHEQGRLEELWQNKLTISCHSRCRGVAAGSVPRSGPVYKGPRTASQYSECSYPAQLFAGSVSHAKPTGFCSAGRIICRTQGCTYRKLPYCIISCLRSTNPLITWQYPGQTKSDSR